MSARNERFTELEEMIRAGWGDRRQDQIPPDWRTRRPHPGRGRVRHLRRRWLPPRPRRPPRRGPSGDDVCGLRVLEGRSRPCMTRARR